MNRFRKEEGIKRHAILESCSPLDLKRFEYEEAIRKEVFELAHQTHIKHNHEEYDFMLDDHVDCAARRKGVNPMSEEYISTVAQKRAEAGVSPLGDDGMPVSPDTWEIAYADAERTVRN